MFPLQSPQEVWGKREKHQNGDSNGTEDTFVQIWKEKEIINLFAVLSGNSEPLCHLCFVCFDWRDPIENEWAHVRHLLLPNTVFRVRCCLHFLLLITPLRPLKSQAHSHTVIADLACKLIGLDTLGAVSLWVFSRKLNCGDKSVCPFSRAANPQQCRWK